MALGNARRSNGGEVGCVHACQQPQREAWQFNDMPQVVKGSPRSKVPCPGTHLKGLASTRMLSHCVPVPSPEEHGRCHWFLSGRFQLFVPRKLLNT